MYKSILFNTLSAFLFSCHQSDKNVNNFTKSFNTMEMLRFLDSINLDTAFLKQAQNINAYVSDTFYHCYELNLPDHKSLALKIGKTKLVETRVKDLMEFAKDLYLLSPEGLYSEREDLDFPFLRIQMK